MFLSTGHSFFILNLLYFFTFHTRIPKQSIKYRVSKGHRNSYGYIISVAYFYFVPAIEISFDYQVQQISRNDLNDLIELNDLNYLNNLNNLNDLNNLKYLPTPSKLALEGK